jgi:chemotaxis protein MotB
MKITSNRPGIFLTGFMILFFSFSCVSTTKFHELEDRNKTITEDRDRLLEQNEGFSVENAEMKAKLNSLEEEINSLSSESDEAKKTYDQLSEDYNDLSKRYEDLQKTQDAVLSGHTRETQRLLTELQKTQEDMQLKEDRLSDLEKNINEKMKEAEKLRLQLDERNRRLIELERILTDKDSIMRALKNTISDALFGFQQDGLSVTIRDGKVYVSMEEKLLFETGSIEVDPKGVSALKKLGQTIEDIPDIYITIEGHTDDVPVKVNPSYHDNWDLSVKRATSIVRILLENSSIDPEKLIASGRSEYLPVDSRKTPEARQKNRRTEIIITPRLDELYRLLESK